jgi:predicted O-methyltransferase YrrM
MLRFTPSAFLSHPLALWHYWRGRKEPLHDIMLLRAGKILLKERFDQKAALRVLQELREGDFIPMNTAPGIRLPGNKPTHFFGKFLYFIVRLAKPAVMIETGVAHGVSSWTILNAMNRNGVGKLYSIDLPDHDLQSYNPVNIQQSSGWVVPDALKSRWDLRLGTSTDLLPGLLKEAGPVDLFFHDSDHSYSNMKFEFNTVLPFLKKPGLIVSDDVHKNTSFDEFVAENRLTGIAFFSKGGAAFVG